jgi:hypothetical protein
VKALGWLTAAFGLYATLMVLFHWSEQPANDAAVRFGASAILALAGFAVVWRARRREPRIDATLAEQHVLRVARAHGGRITATEVAAETPVPLAQASELLESLTRRSLCRMSVAEAGILVFEFPELETAEPPKDDDDAQARAARAAQTERN